MVFQPKKSYTEPGLPSQLDALKAAALRAALHVGSTGQEDLFEVFHLLLLHEKSSGHFNRTHWSSINRELFREPGYVSYPGVLDALDSGFFSTTPSIRDLNLDLGGATRLDEVLGSWMFSRLPGLREGDSDLPVVVYWKFLRVRKAMFAR